VDFDGEDLPIGKMSGACRRAEKGIAGLSQARAKEAAGNEDRSLTFALAKLPSVKRQKGREIAPFRAYF
jgi:hypothetical protein